MWGNESSSHCWLNCKLVSFGTTLWYLVKLKMGLPCNPALGDVHNSVHRAVSTVHCSLLCSSKKVKTTYLFYSKEVNFLKSVAFFYTMEYYTVKNELQLHVSARVNIKTLLNRKIKQVEKLYMLYDSTYLKFWNPQTNITYFLEIQTPCRQCSQESGIHLLQGSGASDRVGEGRDKLCILFIWKREGSKANMAECWHLIILTVGTSIIFFCIF